MQSRRMSLRDTLVEERALASNTTLNVLVEQLSLTTPWHREVVAVHDGSGQFCVSHMLSAS